MIPSTIMFDRLEWLSIPKRLMYNKAVLTYKALNNLAPAYIHRYYTEFLDADIFLLVYSRGINILKLKVGALI